MRERAERNLRSRTSARQPRRRRTGLLCISEELRCQPSLSHTRLARQHQSTTVRRSPVHALHLAASANERPRCLYVIHAFCTTWPTSVTVLLPRHAGRAHKERLGLTWASERVALEHRSPQRSA